MPADKEGGGGAGDHRAAANKTPATPPAQPPAQPPVIGNAGAPPEQPPRPAGGPNFDPAFHAPGQLKDVVDKMNEEERPHMVSKEPSPEKGQDDKAKAEPKKEDAVKTKDDPNKGHAGGNQ